ncbi:molybdopterin dehydrogenase FAD-binding protein [Halanaerobium hydrogeniformans]|uniref:Molybdopterin dehydrogenase FAD-binding protein n=2 Tax=Halanaerobium hydrogeniformans TaxID=656519 RepID=E4RJV0_HALHG|nr:molybdopterin dehydrogenase FAD-binding protein [Halanaerobium hydrogeniformans]
MKVENRQTISGKDFENYFQPKTLKKALEIKEKYQDEIIVLAGATDVLVEKYERLNEIKHWLDLSRIKELKFLDFKEDKILIGPLMTHYELKNSQMLKERLSILAKASAAVGSPQIRSRGTIGGNICTSSPAGDTLSALLASDASFKLQSQEGSRLVKAEEFFLAPKRNILKENELLTQIEIPLYSEPALNFWSKIGRRKALVISTLNLALVLYFDRGIIKRAGLAVGSAAPTPIRLREVEEMMIGKSLAELNYRNLGEELKKRVSPIDDIRGTKKYRENVVRDIMENALESIEKRREGGKNADQI